MDSLAKLLDNNRQWAGGIVQTDPGFFLRLSQQQKPDYLWIGCSDSRVPANEIVGLLPGELFVHRNVGNLVLHSDMNCLSVLQFAIDFLKIQHVIVCGHYGCGGVRAALESDTHGLVDNWLRNIRDVYKHNKGHLAALSFDEKTDRLCELNVVEQVKNVGNTTIVQDAWGRGMPLHIHGWIYSISDGLLRDMNICIRSNDDLNTLEHEG